VRRHLWRAPRGPAASRRCSSRFTVRLRAPWLGWDLESPMAPHHCGAILDLPSIDMLPSVYSGRFDPPSVGGQPWPPIAFRPRGFAPPRRFAPLDPRQIPICQGDGRFPCGLTCHRWSRGLVASRCRSWGSLRFGPRSPRWLSPSGAGILPAARFTPFGEVPPLVAAPRHRGRCLRAVRSTRVKRRLRGVARRSGP